MQKLDKYANDPEVIDWIENKGKKLQKAVMVFNGWEQVKISRR